MTRMGSSQQVTQRHRQAGIRARRVARRPSAGRARRVRAHRGPAPRAPAGHRATRVHDGRGAPRDAEHRRGWWESSDAIIVGGMQAALDPYTPGSGKPPQALIGRDNDIDALDTPRSEEISILKA